MKKSSVAVVLFSSFVVVGVSACGGGESSNRELDFWNSFYSGKTATWTVSTPLSPLPDTNRIIITEGLNSGGMDITKTSSEISGYGFGTNISTDTLNPVPSPILLKLPVVVGDVWSANGTSNGSYTITASVTVVSNNESVTNPKGVTATNCAHTHETIVASAGYLTTTDSYQTGAERWFCPGYGPFKFVASFSNGAKSTAYIDAFTPVGTVDPTDYWPMAAGNTWTIKN